MLEFVQEIRLRNEPLFYFGLLNLVAALAFLVLSKGTDTQVYNVSAWYKPTKFALSTTILSWSMAWYCYYLKGFNIALFSWSVIILLGFEVVYIAIQAGRGQLSHYNTSTPGYAFLYSLMALAATAVTLYVAYVGVLFFLSRFPDLPTYYVWAIRLGIIIFVIFSLEGFVMGSRLTHTIGGSDGGEGIPFLNWSYTYGDPRIAHFIGMHALQVLPILAFYGLKSTRATLWMAGLYGLLALFTLVQALNGQPLIRTHKMDKHEIIKK